ncbi:hypothetical protein BDV25DRAFT_147571 [Aspergillus avenaceus]|uniref:Uncharacterized protein n=1 Tax=Aspergillus avenaceus TaxID=36643 RepID=A0A5N6U7J2_ASPAV|nr:hypothetical protein BDV25DRAFT_147571 [Aspergillus avenaceus]
MVHLSTHTPSIIKELAIYLISGYQSSAGRLVDGEVNPDFVCLDNVNLISKKKARPC